MPNINAALGLAQMERIEEIVADKRDTALKYDHFFKKLCSSNHFPIQFFSEPSNACSNYWLNTVLFSDVKERNKFLEYTNESNVMTRPVWRLNHRLNMYKGCQVGDLSNATNIERRAVYLPGSVRNEND